MKHKFLVIALSYWGRGDTLRDAAGNCRKAGAARTAYVIAKLYLHPKKDPAPEVINGGLNIECESGSQVIEIGQMFKLSTLLKLKEGA